MTRAHRNAFTLVELLVVITIIGMLMALLIPAVQAARGRAKQIQCTNNLNQLAKACFSYQTAKDSFPGWKAGDPATLAYGWLPQLFAYIDRNDLRDALRKDMAATPIGTAHQVYLPIALCPADPQPTKGGTPLSYVANGGYLDVAGSATAPKFPKDWKENGVFMDLSTSTVALQKVTTTAIKDGMSTTLLLSENIEATDWTDVSTESKQCVLWDTATPTPPVFNGRTTPAPRPSSFHSGSFIVAFCDGSTRALSDEIDYRVYALLMTPDGAKAKLPGSTALISVTNPWVSEPLNQGALE